MPSLEVRFNWTISRISKIKITKKTASGKSADLEITTRYKNYEGEVTENVTTVDKVRMDKIQDAVLYSKDKIVA